MAGRREHISLDDVTFDNAGRAVIHNPATVERLKGAKAADTAAIKNIGCCSAPEKISGEQLSALGKAMEKLHPDVANAIKNIGCCSAPEGVIANE